MLKKFLVGCFAIFLLLIAGVKAQAADITNWNEAYIGVNAGVDSATANMATTVNFSPTGYFAQSSTPAIGISGTMAPNLLTWLAGLMAGFNAQAGDLVLGIETDMSYMPINVTQSASNTYPCCAPTGYTVTQNTTTDWVITFRPRIGVAFNDLLIYGTGGVAFTDMNYHEQFTDTFATAAESADIIRTQSGYTCGGGAELMMDKGMSLGVEGLYTNFGKAEANSNNMTAFTPPIGFPSNPWGHSVNLDTVVIRASLRLKL